MTGSDWNLRKEESSLMGNRRFVFTILGCYLLGVGVLTGMLIEDIRFDKSRNTLLIQLENETSTLRKHLIAIERQTGVDREAMP